MACGLGMTDEMLDLVRANQERAGLDKSRDEGETPPGRRLRSKALE
jgi:hypothetical protein